jgi:hypothetical protein
MKMGIGFLQPSAFSLQPIFFLKVFLMGKYNKKRRGKQGENRGRGPTQEAKSRHR